MPKIKFKKNNEVVYEIDLNEKTVLIEAAVEQMQEKFDEKEIHKLEFEFKEGILVKQTHAIENIKADMLETINVILR